MKYSILFVDDEVDNLDALERLFRKKFNVFKATSGHQALTILSENSDLAVIVSDQRMPQMSGVELLEKSIASHPDAIRILLTGYTDIESVIAAVNSGQIYRYITKPWDPRDLVVAVERGIERYELTAELRAKNAALSRALDDLRSLDEAKGHFMILIGHELKTPLTSILNFIELLKMSTLDGDQVKAVDRIERSSQRLKEIVFDVLELMAAETEIMPFNPRLVDLSSSVTTAMRDLESIAREKKQSLEVAFEIGQIFIDEKILVGVLRRILHNAIKFGTPEHPIQVRSERITPEYASVCVSNFGPILQPDTIAKILKPFSINENIMNHSKGLGLGLSLSQALLKRAGSELNIRSENELTSVSFLAPMAALRTPTQQ